MYRRVGTSFRLARDFRPCTPRGSQHAGTRRQHALQARNAGRPRCYTGTLMAITAFEFELRIAAGTVLAKKA